MLTLIISSVITFGTVGNPYNLEGVPNIPCRVLCANSDIKANDKPDDSKRGDSRRK